MQNQKVGLASYHFIAEDGEGEQGAYISYEHPLCSRWPTLDNGLPVPSRVPFRDVRWDARSQTFGGIIDWENGYGTTWQGSKSWRYEIVFDTEYTCIVSGTVFSVVDGGAGQTEWSFGKDLIYINAAIAERFSDLLGFGNNGHREQSGDSLRNQHRNGELEVAALDSESPSQVQNSADSPGSSPNLGRNSPGGDRRMRSAPRRPQADDPFLQISAGLRHRLAAEGASQLTIAAMSRLLRAVQHRNGDETPIDFNLYNDWANIF